MWGVVVFSIFLIGFQDCQADSDKLVVQLQDGKVRGTTLSTPDGNTYYTWRHIPFAKPPLAELRFQPPERPDKWDDILDGSKESKACVFILKLPNDPDTTYGNSEDCMYISVYSPVEPHSNLSLPVMFSIYGGRFVTGSADAKFLDPAPFMEENVIVVSFNYRLGIFGFLSLQDDILLGNSALKDQHQALLWTKENIGFFGGNPDDITIFGNSAGAFSVAYHLVSPISRNLFSGAIMESGASLISSLQVNARNNAIDVAKQIEPTITIASSSEDILSVLQSADAELLVNLTKELLVFTPVLEPWSNKSFIYEPFYEALEGGNFTQVPVIIGVTSEEGLGSFTNITVAYTLAEEYDLNKTLLMPNFYNLKAGVSVEDVTEEVKTEYVGNETFADNVGSLVTFISDNEFVRPILKQAVLQSQYSPVYLYFFSFAGTRSINNPIIPGCGRVAHADELPYIFNITNKGIETDADYLARRRLVKLWTNFAKTKNPTPGDDLSEELQNVTWEPFTKNELKYLEIGDDLTMKSHLKANQSDFWDRLWEKYAERPYNTF